ncbi:MULTISPECIES: DUF1700 domain-containing protein [Paenibacillus]|uniref:DUF1700 domain-containing protein n=1 Tax=Paenibacillus albilobatus TaxID=2716884 RepID=A0A919XDT3_9BACL|nr:MULTISPECIES: DUF1700 domain-containing protein [Paenibacillus]GIO29160.1 hypothetical protein J2TS6_03010 [Paenibacillus albilobatus]
MISPYGREYLEKLNRYLEKLPDDERMDAVMEIESHIAEGIASGVPEPVILSRLGDPRKLARAYRSERMNGLKGVRSFKDVLSLIGFYCTAGLLSVMVVPVLAVVAYGFGFCAILIVLAGILRTCGVTWINMSIGPGMEIATEYSMLYALVVGGIVGGIAFASWIGLKKYLAFVSERYRRVIPGKQTETTV